MILVPARNEGPRIGAVVRGARTAAPDVDVVVVVNGSEDDTAQAALEAGATVIHSDPGYGVALLRGYQHALSDHRTTWVVQMDADGQHPPSAIPRMRAELRHHDVVIGSRFAPGGSAPGWPLVRRLTVAAMGATTRALTGCPVRDVVSGLQAFNRRTLEVLCREFSVDLTDANVLVRLHRAGLSIGEVGVVMPTRRGGESMHGGLASAIYAGRTMLAVLDERRR